MTGKIDWGIETWTVTDFKLALTEKKTNKAYNQKHNTSCLYVSNMNTGGHLCVGFRVWLTWKCLTMCMCLIHKYMSYLQIYV